MELKWVKGDFDHGKYQLQQKEPDGVYRPVPCVDEPKKECPTGDIYGVYECIKGHMHQIQGSEIQCPQSKPEENKEKTMDDLAYEAWKRDYCVRGKEEKRKKLFDVMLRAYKDAPEVTADGSFPYVATAVIADLEKRIDEFESEMSGESWSFWDIKRFIRKEWL